MTKKNLADSRDSYEKLEKVIGCKWSVSVLEAICQGHSRPGELGRVIEGISTKVLSERLRRLTAYGLLDKRKYPEVPPRTEYALTSAGIRLTAIIDNIHQLDAELKQDAGDTPS